MWDAHNFLLDKLDLYTICLHFASNNDFRSYQVPWKCGEKGPLCLCIYSIIRDLHILGILSLWERPTQT